MLDFRFRSVALGIAVGAGIGAGGAYAYLRRTQPPTALLQQQQGGGADFLPNQGPKATDEASQFRFHQAFKYGIPQTEHMRIYDGFVTAFDLRTRNPKWVLEYVDSSTLRGEGTRDQSQFFEDAGVEARFRSKLDDFRDSGYDRGHMAPAMNHRASQKAMNDTFSLANISPQVGPGFNRDYWARFEKFIKDTAKAADGVYIVTGPLWLPQPDGLRGGKWEMKHPMIGKPPCLVSVPTHYFKVVLAENSSGRHGGHQTAVGAFVMPNAAIDPATPVTAFAVPLEALESVAGAKFFPGYLTDRRRAALDAAALQWQAEGKAQLDTLSRVSLGQDQAVMLELPPPHASTPARGAGRGANKQPVAAAAPAPLQQQQQQQPLGRRHKTVGGDGATHLCDVVACQLPEAGWWEQGGTNSNNKGGRNLSRSNSSSGGSRGRRANSMQEPAAVEAVAAAATPAAVAAADVPPLAGNVAAERSVQP